MKKLALVLSLCISSAPAFASCAPVHEMIAWLAENHGEHPVVMGYSHTGAGVLLTASEHGTWTALVVDEGGGSCIIDHGDGWQNPSRLSGEPV